MMAVNSPTGMNFRLKNTSMLLVISKRPRRRWNSGLRVRITAHPPSGTTTKVVARAWMM